METDPDSESKTRNCPVGLLLNDASQNPLTPNTEMNESLQIRPKTREIASAHSLVVKQTVKMTQNKAVENVRLQEIEAKNKATLKQLQEISRQLSKTKYENMDLEKQLQNDKDDIKTFPARTEHTNEMVSYLKNYVNSCKKNIRTVDFTVQYEKYTKVYEELKCVINNNEKNQKSLEDQIIKIKTKLIEQESQKSMKIAQLKDKVLVLKSSNIEKQENISKIQSLLEDESDNFKKLDDIKTGLEEKLNELLNSNKQENYNKLINQYFQIKLENGALKEKYYNEVDLNKNSKNIEMQENKLSEFVKQSDNLENTVKTTKQILQNKKVAYDNNKLDLIEKLQETENKLQEKKNELLKMKNKRKEHKNDLELLKKENFADLQEICTLKSVFLELKESEREPEKNLTLLDISSRKLSKKLMEIDANCKELENFIKNKSKQTLLENEQHHKEMEILMKKLTDHEISHKAKMEELRKDHEYALASLTYLEEKQRSLKEKLDQISKEKTQVCNELLKSEGVIETKMERLRYYNTYLNKMSGVFTKPDENFAVTSILKSPGKLAGPSPKKVKFHGLESSDGSSQDVKAVQQNKPSFDDWLKMLQENKNE
ncbi:unnamed protein product [Brassicogethes aeneus]|uniref:Uncharacterized protein n=1 Tax=Brassicogethes aeneus TaxID=1431903 RepID=A0A9P0APD9_BRAAE|nr:unnamed protein product [Brassicogethes aeneus]